MRNTTREETKSLLEGDDPETAAKAPESSEPAAEQKRELTAQQKEKLFQILQHRFINSPDHYKHRKAINFADVKRALEANPIALWSLSRMEETGGFPDIVAIEDDAFVFADCSAESPAGRRNCVYDKEAGECINTKFKGNAVDMAEEFGVEIWSEEFYRLMQTVVDFDKRTCSWLKTDAQTRSTGDALLGGRNGDHVRVDMFDARDHYPNRGWRGMLRVQKV